MDIPPGLLLLPLHHSQRRQSLSLDGDAMTRFPLGCWNYVGADKQGPSAVLDWADAGMTLTMSPEFDPECHRAEDLRAILDAAAEENIKMIVCDRRAHWRSLAANEGAYREGLMQAIKDFGGHPATFGFHVGDEPDAADFADACRAYRLQKELAPCLSPFLNLLPWYDGVETRVGYTDWAAYLDAFVEQAQPDLLCYDCYAQMNPGQEGWDMFFTNLREFQAASRRHNIPFWTTLLSVGHFRYRPPREDDLRWQVNTAAAHGAKGILWFFFYMRQPHDNYRVAPIDEHWERTETFAWLSRVNRTFLQWQAPVLLDLTLERTSHVGRAWGGMPLLAGNPLVRRAKSSHGSPLIVSEFSDPRGGKYVAVVNNSQTDCDIAELCIAGRAPRLFRVGWQQAEQDMATGNEWHATTGTDFVIARCWLAPGQMELYRVEG